MTRFDGKTVVITGASAGIGASCARKFAAHGANVVLAARSAEPLRRLAEELGTDVAHAVPTDVSNVAACERLLEEAKSRFGGIDVLVNNAGYNSRGPVERVPVEEMIQVLEVNLRAPLVLTKLVLPTMRAQGAGTIVNVASLAGRFPLDGEATYSATKFGLRVFSFALAEELRDTNIRVAVVSPGPVDTGFITEGDVIDNVPAIVFSQPMSTADEIADLIVASAADGARERTKPVSSGVLATIGYLLPAIRRVVLPLLEKKGEKEKQKFIARQSR
ncbi:MAG: SDR family oxidoreductase [Myxococcales bacterium]|jgi:short-subunit dehydrogenase